LALKDGISSKGKRTVLYRNFEYVNDNENVCGTIAWRCRFHQTMKCKARLTTFGDRVVSSRDSDHNHTGNVYIARAQKAVGEMKISLFSIQVQVTTG